MQFRSAAARLVAAVVLVTLACVPSIARAHDRIDHQRTEAQQHSRFRWTNSCESVPQKVTPTVVVAPLAAPAQTAVDAPPHAWRRLPPGDSSRSVTPPLRFPLGLRAPPLAVS